MRVLRNLHPERILAAALIAATVVAVPVASAADEVLTAHDVAQLRAAVQEQSLEEGVLLLVRTSDGARYVVVRS